MGRNWMSHRKNRRPTPGPDPAPFLGRTFEDAVETARQAFAGTLPESTILVDIDEPDPEPEPYDPFGE